MPTISHDEGMAGFYKQNPEAARDIFSGVLSDGDPWEIKVVLRQIVRAAQLAPASVPENLTNLCTVFNNEPDPSLQSFLVLLKALHFRLVVTQDEVLEAPAVAVTEHREVA